MDERYYLSMLKNEPTVLTVLDLARILRIGKNKAYELVNSGKISSIKIDRKIIIPKLRLVQFLSNENNYQKL
jgi:excisionase family DNA binding protein